MNEKEVMKENEMLNALNNKKTPEGVFLNIEHLDIHMDERVYSNSHYFNGCECEEADTDEMAEAIHKETDLPMEVILAVLEAADSYLTGGTDTEEDGEDFQDEAEEAGQNQMADKDQHDLETHEKPHFPSPDELEEKIMNAFVQALVDDITGKGGAKHE